MNFGINSDFSIEAWVWSSLIFPDEDVFADQVILEKAQIVESKIKGYSLYVMGNGRLVFRMGNGTADITVDSTGGPSPPNLLDGQFHHVAVTVDRDSDGKLYVDGQVVRTFNVASYNGSLHNTAPFVIGNHSYASLDSFVGIIDEVSLYGCALTIGDIQAIHDADTAGKKWNDSPADGAEISAGCVCAAVTAEVGTVTVTVLDKPTITVTASGADATAKESGSAAGRFTITRSVSDMCGSLTVNYTLSGSTAINGTDYQNLSGTLVMAEGQASQTITVTPLNDSLDEPDETVVLTVSANGAYNAGSPNSATVTILDEPTITVTVNGADATAKESGLVAGRFTLTRSASDISGALSVNYTLSGSTAINGTDYQNLSGTVVIAAGQPSQTVTVTPLDDSLDELDETVMLAVSANSAYNVGSPNSATVTILDEPTITVTANGADATAKESGLVAGRFTLTRSASDISGALSVNYTLSGSTAINGADYQNLSGTVVIAAGQPSQTVTVTPLDDSLDELDETVMLAVSANSAYNVGSPSSATVTILDEPTITVTANGVDATAKESGLVVGRFTLTRSATDTSAALSVNYILSGSTAINGTDYQNLSGTVVIAAGQPSQTITVTPLDDSLDELDETVMLAVSANSAYNVGSPNSATVTILDEPTITVTVNGTDATAKESGLVAGRFTLTRSATDISGALSVNYTLSGSTAINGTDYQNLSGTVVIAAGQPSQTVTVTPLDDSLDEPNETVVLAVSANSAYNMGSPNSATVTILDEPIVTVTASGTDAEAREFDFDAPVAGRFIVTRTPDDLSVPLTVNYTLTGSTAQNGVDFQNLSGAVIISIGASFVPVVVSPTDDTTFEDQEIVKLTLSSGGNLYQLGAQTIAQVNIQDDELPVITVSASGADANANEAGLVSGAFTITRPNVALGNSLTVRYSLLGEAENGSDYDEVTGQIDILAGATTARLQIRPIDDSLREGPEAVQLVLIPELAYDVGASGTATLTIQDNELPLVSIFAPDKQAAEPLPGGTGDAGSFMIIREGNLSTSLTVYFTLSTGTGKAANGTDYTSINSPVTLLAGNSTVTVTVQPLHDTIVENNEDVTITLAANAAYVINAAANSATVTIKDDELPVVTVTANDPDAREAGLNPGHVTLTRTGPTTSPLVVSFAVGGTATSGVDYQTPPTKVTIPTGSATSPGVGVTPMSDSLIEQIETVVFTVEGGVQYSIGSANSATVFLDDNNPTAYSANIIRRAAVRGSSTPGIIEYSRTGSALAAAYIPIVAYTGDPLNRRAVLNQDYVLGGSGSGESIFFAANQSKARVLVSPGYTTVTFVELTTTSVPNLPNQKIHFPSSISSLVSLDIPSAEAVEGGATRFVTVRRGNSTGNLTVGLSFSGLAQPGTDHNQFAFQNVTLLNGELSKTVNFSAVSDTLVEGWESTVVALNATDQSYAPQDPLRSFMFIRDNVAAAQVQYLPDGDLDSDGLPDRFELASGRDPSEWTDATLDNDRDGLTDFEEASYGTNPNSPDSDGDGVDDFREVAMGSSPNDPTDGGQAPPDSESVAILLRVGDPTGSRSERYRLDVGAVRFQSPAPGVIGERVYKFRRGQSYQIKLVHTQTTQTAPDYDYIAELLPENSTLPRALLVIDPQGLLGSHDDDPSFVNKTATLIVPKIEVVWENVAGDPALDDAGGGLRIFPDRTSPTDSEPRNYVVVNVKTTPALPNQRVLLKSFDVDDATPRDVDPGLIVDSNDTFAILTGNDNRGTPKAGVLDQTALTLDASGAAAHLNLLQVDNAFAGYGVSPDDNAVFGFLGGVSRMLTVWRKLHLEFDSMTAPPLSPGLEANYVDGSIARVRLNYPVAGHTKIEVVYGLGANEQGINLFEGGKLFVPGVKTYRVLQSSSRGSANGTITTTVEIDEIPAVSLTGRLATLYDDDDRYLQNNPPYPSLLNLPSPLPSDSRSGEFVDAMQSRFAPAYLKLVDANAPGLNWNPANGRTIPFKRNAKAAFLFGNSITSDFDDNLQLKGTDKPEFWAYSVVFGYQSVLFEDGDSDRETPLSAVTPKKAIPHSSHGFSVIYLEAIRDRNYGLNRATVALSPAHFVNSDPAVRDAVRNLYLEDLYGVTAHEIGHAPGQQSEKADHSEGGLMVTGGARLSEDGFSARTIKRFRDTPFWTY